MRARSLRERFEEKYEPVTETGCWLWTAGLASFRYGSIRVGGEMLRASRVSWELYRGEIPEGMHVLHKCDTPLCVNPAHLFLGTNTDNVADRDRKGRQRSLRGSSSGMSKLTDSQVREIRVSNEPQDVIAKRSGVTQSNVSCIRLGKTWRHLL
jgi:hypothetical protein